VEAEEEFGGGVLIGSKSLSNWFDGEFRGANCCWKEFDEVEFPFEFLLSWFGKTLLAVWLLFGTD